MAKSKKSGRSFDLEKGSKHSFDLEKKTTSRFDLEKEDELENSMVAQGMSSIEQSSKNVNNGQTKESHGDIPALKDPQVKNEQNPSDKQNGKSGNHDRATVGGSVSKSPVQTTNAQTASVKPMTSGVDTKGSAAAQRKSMPEPVKTSPMSDGKDSSKPKKRNFVLPIVALVVIGVLVFFFMNKGSKDSETNAVLETEQLTENNQQEANVPVTDNEESDTLQKVESSAGEDAIQSEELKVASSSEETLQEVKPVESVTTKTPQLASTLEERAKQVIRGEFGNGEERKQKLGAAYSEIQRKVNELYRSGNLMQ